MYSRARRLVVPDCERIQPTTCSSSRETKNIRSASPRWEIEKMATRGLPLAP